MSNGNSSFTYVQSVPTADLGLIEADSIKVSDLNVQNTLYVPSLSSTGWIGATGAYSNSSLNNPKVGQVLFGLTGASNLNTLYIYNGSSWARFPASN